MTTNANSPNLVLIQSLRDEILTNKKSIYRKVDNLNVSDDFLNPFLCITKGNVKQAFERYNKFFDGLLELPGIDKIKKNDIDWLIEANNKINDSGFADYYGEDKYNRGVVGMRIRKTPINVPDCKMVITIRQIIFTEILLDPEVGKKDLADDGIIYIMDYADFNMDLMMFWNDIKFNKMHSKITFGALPMKVKKMIIFNQPALFTVFFNIVKMFFSRKVTDRLVCVGTDYEKVIEECGGPEFTPDIVPGGTRKMADRMDGKEMIKYIKRLIPDY